MIPAFCKVQRLESRVSIPLRNTQFDRIRGVSCAVNRPRRRAYPKIGTFPQSLHKRNPLLCAGAEFPDRAARGLSLLLYSPGSHGATLSASGSCGTRDKLNPRAARAGNPTRSSGQRYLPKRDRFVLAGFIWEKAASPSGKRPQALRVDDGKGFFRLSLPC